MAYLSRRSKLSSPSLATTIRLCQRHRIGVAPKGLNDDTVHFISAKKNEPQWLLDWLSLPKAQSGMLSERIADKLRS